MRPSGSAANYLSVGCVYIVPTLGQLKNTYCPSTNLQHTRNAHLRQCVLNTVASCSICGCYQEQKKDGLFLH